MWRPHDTAWLEAIARQPQLIAWPFRTRKALSAIGEMKQKDGDRQAMFLLTRLALTRQLQDPALWPLTCDTKGRGLAVFWGSASDTVTDAFCFMASVAWSSAEWPRSEGAGTQVGNATPDPPHPAP